MFNNNNHIERIINKKAKNNNSIRMITIKWLKIEIEFFKQKSFKFFLNHGLEKNSDQKSTISILLKNKFPQKNKK